MSEQSLENIIHWNKYAPRERDFLPKVCRAGKRAYKTYLCKEWIALDIETAWNHDEENPIGWVYQWAFKFGEEIVIGRNPSQLMTALEAIERALDLGKDRRLVIYVHNLSYDIQYLKTALTERFGKARILAIKPHKFISYEVGSFIFKCSYKLSNKSLATWSSDIGTEHRKLREEKAFYDEIHYQDEELSPENWTYQIRDVVVLDEAIKAQLDAYGDTVLSIPLTSTGYVRRAARKHYKEDRRNRKRFLMTALDAEMYAVCREEFAGGITHGDRRKAGKTITPEREKGEFIRHRDFWSHYPSQQRTRQYPIGKWNLYGEHLKLAEVRELVKEYCVLMKVTFENAHIREGVVLPVISVSKAYKGRITKLDMIEDNGRALDITGTFSLYLTELDLHWILKQYKIDSLDIEKAWVSVKGEMPEYMRKTVDEFYIGKTRWKRELAREKDKPDGERDEGRVIWLSLELMKSKNGLNGIYGMSATDPVRTSYTMDEKGEWKAETPDIETALNKYYESENNFNRYQLGIYCTSYARYELLEFAELIQRHGGSVLYVDTDSIFYVSNKDCEAAIEAENERRKQKAMEKGWFVNVDGDVVHYDCFADEGEDIEAFRFLHAKCYAYKENGKLHCVIAGVSAYEDATYAFSREDELGDIENLKKGFCFKRCGGTKAKYTETPRSFTNIDGHLTEIGPACIITATEKTLKNEIDQYEDLIEWEVNEDGIF